MVIFQLKGKKNWKKYSSVFISKRRARWIRRSCDKVRETQSKKYKISKCVDICWVQHRRHLYNLYFSIIPFHSIFFPFALFWILLLCFNFFFVQIALVLPFCASTFFRFFFRLTSTQFKFVFTIKYSFFLKKK